MKKTLLLALALLISVSIYAQNRANFIYETFDATTMPSGWNISGDGVGNWSISSTNKAGGNANELMLYWSPDFNGISRVVTTPVDLTGVEEVVIAFKHYLDNYSGYNTIGIATSSDNGSTWNTAWSQAYNNSGQFSINETVTSPDMGNSDVLFCLFYEGDSYNINNWYFDDIEIFSMTELDIKLTSIDVNSMLSAGDAEIAFSVQNYGINEIESIEVQYSIDDEEAITETFSTSLASMATEQFTFSETLNLQPGTYNLKVEIVTVNGGEDDDLSNNTLEKQLFIALGSTQKIPMIEHFSSSTCGPCVAVNNQMNALTTNNPGKFTYTKYQMNWPGSGDIYYTEEGGVRRDYYGVSAVPQVFLDGQDQGYAAVTQANLDASYNTPSFTNIRGAFDVDGNTINIIADFMAYSDMPSIKAFVAVNEKVTTGNVGSNGETEFHHVFMKMLENAQGNEISINAGEYQRLEFSYDMSTTHMEDINDLEVALWLQNDVTKEILNSHFAYEYTDHAYPVQNLEIDNDENTIIVSWDAPEEGTPSGYNVLVNGELVAEEIEDETYSFETENDTYIIEVVALYDDKSSVGLVKSFELTVDLAELQANTYKMFPNPANNQVKIVGENINTISIYNCVGALVDRFNMSDNEIEINTAKYNTGIYFINVQHDNGSNSTKKLIVTH